MEKKCYNFFFIVNTNIEDNIEDDDISDPLESFINMINQYLDLDAENQETSCASTSQLPRLHEASRKKRGDTTKTKKPI